VLALKPEDGNDVNKFKVRFTLYQLQKESLKIKGKNYCGERGI
jgi:hypothetical protein